MVELTGQRSVPMIYIDGEAIVSQQPKVQAVGFIGLDNSRRNRSRIIFAKICAPTFGSSTPSLNCFTYHIRSPPRAVAPAERAKHSLM